MSKLLTSLLFFILISQINSIYEKEKEFWVWPKPLDVTRGNKTMWIDEFNFKIIPAGFTHKILDEACRRYENFITKNRGV